MRHEVFACESCLRPDALMHRFFGWCNPNGAETSNSTRGVDVRSLVLVDGDGTECEWEAEDNRQMDFVWLGRKNVRGIVVNPTER